MEQVEDEILRLIHLMETIYDTFGLSFSFVLSTRPKEGTIGSDEAWEKSTSALKNALDKSGKPYKINEGDGAFYGPKIDVSIQDALGRKWQCSTVQLDMSLPERFDLLYDAQDGTRKRPVMIHRAIYGSIERFFGVLIEHFTGKFPFWISPRQVKVIPVADRHIEYAHHIAKQLKERGFHTDVADSAESVSKKIREAQLMQYNYMITVGDREVEHKNVALRTRDNFVLGEISFENFLETIDKERKAYLFNLFLRKKRMKTLTISSFKGGTAKTSTALHLGVALSRHHKAKVLLIDFDAQANLTAGLGFDPDEHDSLAPVLQGNKNIHEVICSTTYPNLDLVPADTWLERVEVTGALAADRYSHERLKAILRPLSYDFVIIDTPPSLCWLTESALIAADHALIAATPEFYSVKGLERLSQFIDGIAKRHPLGILGVILSFWNVRGKNNQAFKELIEKSFPGKLFDTKVRRDILISEAAIFGKSVFDLAPASRAAEDYLAVTTEILNRVGSLCPS